MFKHGSLLRDIITQEQRLQWLMFCTKVICFYDEFYVVFFFLQGPCKMTLRSFFSVFGALLSEIWRREQ
jgi:hypothetical protein